VCLYKDSDFTNDTQKYNVAIQLINVRTATWLMCVLVAGVQSGAAPGHLRDGGAHTDSGLAKRLPCGCLVAGTERAPADQDLSHSGWCLCCSLVRIVPCSVPGQASLQHCISRLFAQKVTTSTQAQRFRGFLHLPKPHVFVHAHPLYKLPMGVIFHFAIFSTFMLFFHGYARFERFNISGGGKCGHHDPVVCVQNAVC
jgi:hypothetical protein